MINLRLKNRIDLKFLLKVKTSQKKCFKILKEELADCAISRPLFFVLREGFSKIREDVEFGKHLGRSVNARSEGKLWKINEIYATKSPILNTFI